MSEAVILLKEILEELDANVATNERIADSDGMKAAVSSARTKLEIWKRRESALSAQDSVTSIDNTFLPDDEWSNLSRQSRLKIAKWFSLAEKYLQGILDEPESSHAPEGETPFCRVCGEAIRVENAEEDSRNDLSKYYFKTPDAEEGDF